MPTLLEFYRLREQPFGVSPDPAYLYLSQTHREALALLSYGIKADRGFMALIAEPGMGKTTLLYQLLEELRDSTRAVFLFQTQCDSRDFLRYLLSELGIDTVGMGLVAMHNKLNEVLFSEMLAGRRFVVFVDEAQNLDEFVLETIRLLTDFETPHAKLLQIVLAGQPQLAKRLADPRLSQLRQRIAIQARLESFNRVDTARYIEHRLKVAGHSGSPLFTAEAVTAIAERSQGIPRNINNLCFNALSLGHSRGHETISAEIVANAADGSILQSPEQPKFAVGTATAAPGHKSTGFIEVPAGVDAATNIPVVVVHGAKSGPVLALVAGAHGTEYASIIALEKLIAQLDPAEMSGTAIVLPLVNVASFEQKVLHVNPVDNKSMNRMYPGKADGTQTERASWLITREVVEQCHYLIDLHGGELDEDLWPYSCWIKVGNGKQDAVSREMVLAFGLDHIVIHEDRPMDLDASCYLDNAATTRGRPAIAVEAGHAGTTEPEDVEALIHGCLNVMRYLKILPGTAVPVERPVWIEKVVSIAGEGTGIFYPAVRRGAHLEAGMKVGYVTDYFGRTIYEAQAPAAGVVLYICAVPSVKKGDTIANIGVVAKKAP